MGGGIEMGGGRREERLSYVSGRRKRMVMKLGGGRRGLTAVKRRG